MIVMNIPALGFNKKSGVEIKVTSHVLTVAASEITPDVPKALTGYVDIPKDIFYYAKRVTWDFADEYLRVTFPLGTPNTMVQGSFYVKWAAYEEPTII
ncbi:hypothetical protein CTI12_AA543290 [Artemisia annua]|uniref:Uncharacterized protein n=1 Tax=Artemisia annua TaxID=35608 RepID=A0A2U1L103_ARTAN|nr:hypothetical protein CTI12_AA543290 [Artemisia annua]